VHGDLVLEAGRDIAARVKADGGVLGAFFYRNADLAAKIEEMFRLAVENDLDLDFHVDEGLDVEADGFSLIVDATRRHRMAGRVLCGHACSLSLRPLDELTRILGAAAQAGVALVSLPTTNLYLQDRIGGKSPRLRGVAPLKEARLAGVEAMLGSDNVRDAFYPYGDYDPLAILRLAAPVCHLEPDAWLDSITTLPARLIRSERVHTLSAGGAANFIWHDAEDLNDLISRPQALRRVWRDGIVSDLVYGRNP
jgi:cytosine deaminase